MLRSAAVAGEFYPNEREALANILEELTLTPAEIQTNLRILVSPHAAIWYSGKTAGKGFSLLRGLTYKRVILLGVSHQAGFPYAAVDDHQEWETPLGLVATDKMAMKQIIDGDLIRIESQPHLGEHTLEMQLIFLQHLLKKEFKILPILLGSINQEKMGLIGEKLASLMNPESLLVISTDLSHYPPGQEAYDSDQQVIRAFTTGNPEIFLNKVEQLEKAGLENLLTAACGAAGLATGLYAAKKLGTINFKLINYSHSGMISNDHSRVVGYASIAGYEG